MTTTIKTVPDPSRAEFILNLQAQEADFRLARKNERFAKASPARKRVIIAKDVLEWLAAKKIVATPGTYLSSAVLGEGGYENGRVKSDRVNGGKCSACALGAVFACAVEREGGFKGFWNTYSDTMQEHLKPFFSLHQLQLIEAAFERSSGFVTVGPDDKPNHHDEDGNLVGPTHAESPAALAAEAFGNAGERRWDATKRMEAIMRNIIANKGTFIP